MQIKDVFDRIEDGAVRAKVRVTMKSQQGAVATVLPGTEIDPISSPAGYTGKWIADNLDNDVPSSWTVGELASCFDAEFWSNGHSE